MYGVRQYERVQLEEEEKMSKEHCNDGLDDRCRDNDGEIRRKRSDTLVDTLRHEYGESFAKDFARMPIDLPVAVSIFKGDFFTPPKVWGDQTYSKLFYWKKVPKSGHFAALEQPELFVAELRKSFAQVR